MHFLELEFKILKDPNTETIFNCAPLEYIENAILKGKHKNVVCKEKGDTIRNSQTFFNSVCAVSINPDTGILIQCNFTKGNKDVI